MNEENNKSETAKKEEEILNFWDENKIFEKSLEKDSPQGEFVFYEGPPTANGKPGVHHMESRSFKDIIPRYKTMRGYHVRRKGGWDTHGLPVELQVEKELGLKSKKEIEEYGVVEFNKKCKESVWMYMDEWLKFSRRIAFWLDQENKYITYEPNYMESIWNIVKKVEDQDLLYKDYKVLPWCPRCGTALSSHELAQGYKDVKDLSVYVKFKVKNPEKHNLPENTYLLAWTTTPWTLPGNVALAVGEKVSYSLVKADTDYLLLASDLVSKNVEDAKIEKEFMGKDLVGLEYESLYSYMTNLLPDSEKEKLENAFKVYNADFVTTEDGTGIVHTAVMYGADDFVLGTEVGLPKFHLVNQDGLFIDGMDFLSGRFVKDEATDVEIIKDLHARGLLFKKEKYEHTYPFCWRCKTALIYYARDSWYIRMSSLRDELVKENEDINWEPSHIKEGRFGEWLREIKDWAISRERYWGTPLPVWESEDGEVREVIGSVEELKKLSKKSGNTYTLMRHGHYEGNTSGMVSSDPEKDDAHNLSDVGKQEALEAAKMLSKEKIDLIFASDFERTKETANVVAEHLGLSKDAVIMDKRLREISTGIFEGKHWSEYHASFSGPEDRFYNAPEGGESLNDLRKRLGDFIFDIDSQYKNKKILIISHALSLYFLDQVSKGSTVAEILDEDIKVDKFKTAESRSVDFWQLPHNDDYELDLHKPYIDEVVLEKDGKELRRVKEVMDVWFDSGAMPFAQDHYPFENKEWVEGAGYPADYISEAIDQTRGWFYTLHAIGVLMGKGKAYKNVVCLGHILDAEGKKMSKSIGNIVDPWEMSNKYGVDAMRFWMYSVNQPGDSKNFDEKTVDEIVKKVFNLYRNTLNFYKMYEAETSRSPKDSPNILDQWILSLFGKLLDDATKSLDSYKVIEPARAIRDFMADLSQWYVRRSRDRFKNEGEDKEYAQATLRFILIELSKLMAPFTPFIAEEIFQDLKKDGDPESVHLADWPNEVKVDEKVVENMKIVRNVVTQGLEKRTKSGVKVRQPLSKLTITEKLSDEYLELIKDEVNVKEVVVGKEVELDTEITPELELEGRYRDLVREIQDLRKEKGLSPSDFIELSLPDEYKDIVEKFESDLKKTVQAKEIKLGTNKIEI